MSDSGPGPGVDFVVGEDASGPVDELAPMATNTRLRTALVVVVAGVVAALAIGHVAGSQHAHPAAATSTPTAVPTGRFTPPPDLIGAPLGLPEGNRPTYGLLAEMPHCPAAAACSVTVGVTHDVRAAVTTAFPHARITGSTTILVGRTGSQLTGRTVRARGAGRDVTVRVGRTQVGDIDADERKQPGGTVITDVIRVRGAFTVSVHVVSTHGADSYDRLARLATDRRLVQAP